VISVHRRIFRASYLRRLALAATPLAAAALCSAGCGGTSSTAAPAIITNSSAAVILRAESLVTGVGCGTADSEVYKYVAVLSAADGSDVDGEIYDCFADAIFAQLDDYGLNAHFTVHVFAFDKVAYEAKKGDIALNFTKTQPMKSLGATYAVDCAAQSSGQAAQAIAICPSLWGGVAGDAGVGDAGEGGASH
jgi:hypothetical protein